MRRSASVVILLGFLILYFSIWQLIAFQLGSGYAAWHALRVPAAERSYDDARLLLEGLDCVRAGINPYLEVKCDWRFRLFNYPSIWLLPQHVGLTVDQTDAFGFTTAALFVVSLLVVFGRTTPLAGLLGGVCLVSPAVMLGIARGNTDLLIFSLLVATATLAFALPRAQDATLATGLVILSILKLYPIAAVVALLRPTSKAIALAGIVTAIFALWIFNIRADLVLVQSNTPAFAWKSFGYKTAFIESYQFFEPGFLTPAGLYPAPLPSLLNTVALSTLLVVVIVSVALGARLRQRMPVKLEPRNPAHFYFLVGASIYVLTFALGANFNYRLIFLLLCIPLLTDWLFEKSNRRSLAIFLATGCIGLCWFSASSGAPFEPSARSIVLRMCSEVISWCLFAGLGTTLANHAASVFSAWHTRPRFRSE
jgi:hypothetical protein